MYNTSDAGKSWTPLPAGNANASTVNYLDANHAWLLSGDGKTLLASSDGGQHWQQRDTGLDIYTGAQDSNSTPGQIDFSTLNIGWLLGFKNNASPTLLKTTDGGQHWQPLSYTIYA